jgi:diguanylate cyclase (GGDEF)-like protein
MLLAKRLETVVHQFQCLPPMARDSGIVLMVGLVSFVDFVTSPSIFLTGFYLLPIGLAVWYSARAVTASVILLSLATSLCMVFYGLPESVSLWQLVLAYLSPLIVLLSFAGLIFRQKLMMQKLLAESRTDALTGIRNRRGFLEIAGFELARLNRGEQAATLALIDMDNFKCINDTQGHAVGDALLIAVSRCMVTTLREVDIVARLGGDEFVVLLPETDGEMSKIVLERLHVNLKMLLQSFDQSASTSIGAVTTAACHELEIDEILAQADAVMYAVKSAAKDGVAFRAASLPDSVGG